MVYFHRCKKLILCFVSTTNSIITIAKELRDRFKNQKVCTKIKDHAKFFVCLCSHGGFNNNPNVIQFRTTIKKILLRNFFVSSNIANVLPFEAGTQSAIFSFEIKKNQTSITNLISSNQETADSTANRNVERLLQSIVHSKVTDNILFYISGYMIRNFVTNIDFQDCVTSMAQPAVSTDYQYSATPYVIFLYVGVRLA